MPFNFIGRIVSAITVAGISREKEIAGGRIHSRSKVRLSIFNKTLIFDAEFYAVDCERLKLHGTFFNKDC